MQITYQCINRSFLLSLLVNLVFFVVSLKNYVLNIENLYVEEFTEQFRRVIHMHIRPNYNLPFTTILFFQFFLNKGRNSLVSELTTL
jgi:hypothetical protein